MPGFTVFLTYLGQEGILIFDSNADDPVSAYRDAKARAASQMQDNPDCFELHGVTSKVETIFHWAGTNFIPEPIDWDSAA